MKKSKELKETKNIDSRKRFGLSKAIIICIFICCISIALYLWKLSQDNTPVFFPLDNSNGVYRITQKCPQGQGWNQNFEGSGKAFCVEYQGKNVFSDDKNSNFFRITVGKSDVDLSQFNGKIVKNIKGNFTSSSTSCNQDMCIDIGGPYSVLNIDYLELEN